MSDEVELLARASAARFARWDDGYFRSLAARAGELPDANSRGAWLRLCAEGVGLERLGPARGGVLAHLLVERLPAVAALPPRERVRWLARAWNLAESLAAEPEWLEAFAHAALVSLDDVSRLEARLVAMVGPVLAPAPPATWTGPLAMLPLDPRGLDADFLPGDLEPIAPRVIAVRDRLRDKALALVVSPEGCRFFPLGIVPPRWSPADAAPAARFEAGRVKVASLDVALPTVRRAQAVLAMPSGAVACAATDSQYVWVGRSP